MNEWANNLEAELKWRESELASLKKVAISSRYNQVAHRAMLRALWAMLYAHYEGFTKYCWELVLDEIQKAKVPRQELQDCVAVLSLEEFFSRTRGDTSSANLWKVFRTELAAKLGQNAEFPTKHRPDTKCNLWPNVFCAETARLGIACPEFETSKTRLGNLVGRRNKIAHGDALEIQSIDEYSDYERVVVLLMHDLAVQVLEYLEGDAFRAA